MPEKVDQIHDSLMQDPDFEPEGGKTKDESAWSVAWSRYKQMNKNEEALSMANEAVEKQQIMAKPMSMDASRDARMRKQGPPRPGLVPQSGDPTHPGRWIKPDLKGTGLIDPVPFSDDKLQTSIDLAEKFQDPGNPKWVSWYMRLKNEQRRRTPSVSKLNKFVKKQNDVYIPPNEVGNTPMPQEGRNRKMQKQGPPRPGLVPQSGDPIHPGRWVKPGSHPLHGTMDTLSGVHRNLKRAGAQKVDDNIYEHPEHGKFGVRHSDGDSHQIWHVGKSAAVSKLNDFVKNTVPSRIRN